MITYNFIKCDSIKYRQGFIQVSTGIHPNCINVEIWNINPDTNIDSIDILNEINFEDEQQGNIEIELNEAQTRTLIHQLNEALKSISNIPKA